LDRPDETVAAIGSALAQTGLSRHVIVVDQGSAPENLARLADAVAEREDATLVRTARNLGVPGGRNLASALGRGRVIVALDSDAEFATERTAAAAVAAFDADPALGAIGFRILAHATGEEDHSSWGYPLRLKSDAAGSFDTATFVGAGHAIRRAAWEDAGGYDASLFFCWEEYDFCVRAISRGWIIRYRGDIVTLHKVSPQRRVSWSGARWYHFVRNRLYIERKYGAVWPVVLFRAIGYLLKGARHGLATQTVRGIVAGLCMAWTTPTSPLPAAAREYLRRTDRAHRGRLIRRLRDEVLAALPAPAQAPKLRANRSRISSLKTAGSSSR
jgi:GT2 family glycosyltransferase